MSSTKSISAALIQIESNNRQTRLVSWALIALGILFWIFTRNQIETSSTHQYAYWLGLLLAGVGGLVLLLNEKITITANPNLQMLHYQSESTLGSKSFHLAFQNFESVRVRRIGRSTEGSETFHLVLKLKTGKTLPTGKWSPEAHEVNVLARELAQVMGIPFSDQPEINRSRNLENAMIAGALAVAVYLSYYRLTVGPFCLAMWAGTAPPVIMSLVFFSVFPILRRRRSRQ